MNNKHFMERYITEEIQIDPSLLVGDFTSYKSILQCAICFNIVIKPSRCQECDTLFCSECIKQWVNTNKTCPTCRHDFNLEKASVNRVTRELLNQVKLKCKFYNIGCTDEILYENYVKHYKEECSFVNYYCQDCLKEGNIDFMKSHACKVKCAYCNKTMPLHRKQIHYQVCKSRVCKCYCGLEIPFKRMKTHLKFDCKKVECECEMCLKVGTREELVKYHNMKECLDYYVSNLVRDNGVNEKRCVKKMYNFLGKMEYYEIGGKVRCLEDVLKQYDH